MLCYREDGKSTEFAGILPKFRQRPKHTDGPSAKGHVTAVDKGPRRPTFSISRPCSLSTAPLASSSARPAAALRDLLCGNRAEPQAELLLQLLVTKLFIGTTYDGTNVPQNRQFGSFRILALDKSFSAVMCIKETMSQHSIRNNLRQEESAFFYSVRFRI